MTDEREQIKAIRAAIKSYDEANWEEVVCIYEIKEILKCGEEGKLGGKMTCIECCIYSGVTDWKKDDYDRDVCPFYKSVNRTGPRHIPGVGGKLDPPTIR